MSNLNTEQYFSLVPQIHAPRSVFDRSFTHKTTMNVNKLYPIFIDELLPGDSVKMHFQANGQLINPLVVPIKDELYFETLWFKCDMRLLWNNTFKFFGEKDSPDDTTDYVIPTINSGSGFTIDSLADHFGIPTGVANLDVNVLPFRMYNRVYNEWFKDQNLITSVVLPLDDQDSASNYTILNSAKVHDLFTSALPTRQLGDSVSLPIGNSAPIVGQYIDPTSGDTAPNPTPLQVYDSTGAPLSSSTGLTAFGINETGTFYPSSNGINTYDPDRGIAHLSLRADLSTVTGIDVNDLRFLIKLQRYRERLLLGGHRYREIVSQFFQVDQLDNRVYTSEFLGMTREMVDINTVVQTSSTDATSPQGHLTAYGLVNTHGNGFNTSSLEHGYLMGIARFRHTPCYQQGLHKMWSRSTSLDFYNPIFNGLGEQPILNKEIMAQGASVLDTDGTPVDDKAFGFNEYGYEYRFYPNMITGALRSGRSGSLDMWHLSQWFGSKTENSGTVTYTPVLPVLNQSFIEETIPIDRVVSLEPTAEQPAFIMDFRFLYTIARVMPVRNVPADLYSGI